ncbi:beta-N-acetylhexosaminidase [Nitrogeniibacter mangrovi]|uniref:Beta-hexosaminidase n=1 Tax=Nitrogeniibacter mangrovi TaxID=2016596 RepID=A0A6C1B2I5_9RHOO|nr:beta-N-acetylhexosaminidase [Nitrogeniibacter mangrovi]QID17777.1 beta-N-acetylhexosaminidase [Nitrogeniibacter mangrovi]
MSTATRLPLGPVMLDVVGLELTDVERAQLRHPLVGGVILFARNYESPVQLAALTADIAAQRDPALLITVDHEGGRVQRFREGFCRLPTMRALGVHWERDPLGARQLARDTGWVLAAELAAVGVDMSYTPVLDLDYGVSRVIGDRAFHTDPEVVVELAGALMDGLADGGMACVGKHFPGHGYVEADSHVDAPRDPRPFDAIWSADMLPFRRLAKRLAGVMPAHVIYEAIDPRPAGFSRFWLQDVLRGRVGFDGLIFSDDLTMEAATEAGGIVARASAAHAAGCDMVLVCNRPDLNETLLAHWQVDIDPALSRRLEALRRRAAAMAARGERWQAAREAVAALTASSNA